MAGTVVSLLSPEQSTVGYQVLLDSKKCTFVPDSDGVIRDLAEHVQCQQENAGEGRRGEAKEQEGEAVDSDEAVDGEGEQREPLLERCDRILALSQQTRLVNRERSAKVGARVDTFEVLSGAGGRTADAAFAEGLGERLESHRQLGDGGWWVVGGGQ